MLVELSPGSAIVRLLVNVWQNIHSLPTSRWRRAITLLLVVTPPYLSLSPPFPVRDPVGKLKAGPSATGSGQLRFL